MSEKLTPQQKMAVVNRGGRLLVSAAAGSGKTKVLVDRLMSYMTEPMNPANLDDFLIITYTKAAAAELRGKISDKLTKYITDHPENLHMHKQIQRLHLAKICTVHSFCADILREYAYRLDIAADFRIAEDNECQEMMFEALQELLDAAYTENLDDIAFRSFVDTQGLGRDDRQITEIILQIYSSALCHLDPDCWLDWCVDAAKVDGLSDASATVWGAYLITDLKQYLNMQIRSLEKCIESACAVPGMEKPTMLLSTTVADLRSLESCCSWDEIVNHRPVEYGTLTFNKETKGTLLAEQIKAIRNACKDGLSKKLRTFSDHSDVVLSHLMESSLASEGLVKLVKAFKAKYEHYKKIRRVMDFSDIEQRTLDILMGKHRTGTSAIAREIGSRYIEIMVDEYQDSNEVQDAIFTALTNERQNCFMVGDVKQSIYQFRLADPGIFLDKYNSYAYAEDAQPGQGRKVLLSNNFRSSGGVIRAVNDVFTQCMSEKVGGLRYTEDEMLREGIPHIPLLDKEIELYGIDVVEDTYQEEAACVAQRILQLLNGKHMIRQGEELRPITPDDIVILLRSPGSVGGEFRYALENIGIPCTMGSDLDLLQAPEVETLRSILQIIHNPLQDIPLIAALSSPVFGFTADELAKIRSNNRYSTFYHAIANSENQKATAFIRLLTKLRKDARFLTNTQLIHQIFVKTGMLSTYGSMENGDELVHNLQSFCQVAAEYEATGRKDLTYFLEHLTAMEEKGLTIAGNAPSGAIRIMSIHKSKGLEFPVVFLCGLSRSFNMADIQKQVLCHKDLGLGLTHTNTLQRVRFPTIAKRAIAAKISQESISEELRVLYVAMTRAKDRMIMTYAASKLDERLKDIALRLDMSDRELLTSHVSCPGSWVLLTALQRTEAGEFFNLADKPACTQVQDDPWLVRVLQAQQIQNEAAAEEQEAEEITQETLERMRRGLAFHYANETATRTPSKLTATQLKGRSKDQEAAEFTGTAQTRKLEFATPCNWKNVAKGTQIGNAFHHVMQYLDFSKCCHTASICQDLERMVTSGLITQEYVDVVDVEKIKRFFQTPLGQRLLQGKEVLREFKFSILEDAQTYYPGITNDKILLQGVIDCALIEDDGITVLDFKTDHITESNLGEKVAGYREQVCTYARALSEIYEKPVTEMYIYFFSAEKLISIE